MDTEAKIRSIVRSVCRKEVIVDRQESLFESGLLDSFALIDLVSAIEEEFRLSVPDADLSPRTFSSIDKIEDYLRRRGAG